MFQIIKQSHPVKGCIPACARSVLFAAGEGAPTEDELIAAMYPPSGWSGSGFALLSAAFKQLGMKHEVRIEYPSVEDVAGRIVELNSHGHQVLFPRNAPALHCLVAVECSPDAAVLHNPGSGKVETSSWATAVATWTGDIAYIVIVPS